MKIPADLMAEIGILAQTEVREIPHFPLYAAAPDGRVWSVQPMGVATELPKYPRQMVARWRKGCWMYNLKNWEGNPNEMSAAKVILMTYVSLPPFEGAVALVTDHDWNNLSPQNVEWASHSEYVTRAVAKNKGAFAYGEMLGQSKLTIADVRSIREQYEKGIRVTVLQKLYKVSRRTINRAINGTTWKQVE